MARPPLRRRTPFPLVTNSAIIPAPRRGLTSWGTEVRSCLGDAPGSAGGVAAHRAGSPGAALGLQPSNGPETREARRERAFSIDTPSACYLMVSFRWLSSGACLTIVIV
jgi:hypothetical protein